MIKQYFLSIALLLFSFYSIAQKTINTDVLVVGGGASGVTAAIQAARLGVKVIIVEETSWLGGMITSAGVSAFDGNHNMPSGIWAEFREQLYKVYGGPKQVETGWVSNTLFEPHVGDSIFKAMVSREKNITVLYNHRFSGALITGTNIKGVWVLQPNNSLLKIVAKQTIDATELGDVISNANIPTDIGMDGKNKTSEVAGVAVPNNFVQDMTFVAILKDYGIDKTIPKPNNYDPKEFDGCCKEYCSDTAKAKTLVSARQMLDYGKLPNNKYMINWPNKGNDYYKNYFDQSEKECSRCIAERDAKLKTIRFIYFLQTELGFNNLAIADDEYPTEDKFPLIPYYRESRRVQGRARLLLQHISNPFNYELYGTGIAVGDYPIDHHHKENTAVPADLGFIQVPSYNIPLGSLIPQKNYSGIIVAEKSISVSNIVNGTTRLQPIVILIGQAAGTLAALAAKQNQPAYKVGIRDVQAKLIETKAYIMPYYDVKPTHPHWAAIQRIGATGILRGVGEPYKWANRTWFYPDSLVDGNALGDDMCFFFGHHPDGCYKGPTIDVKELNKVINYIATTRYKKIVQYNLNQQSWTNMGLTNYDETRPLTRVELTIILDKTINPFYYKKEKLQYDGSFK